VKFTKLHGAGNDYVYVDARSSEKNWSNIAIEMSDRHKGIGSDGLILAMESDKADLRMRMFNADGSEGEMCGNGIRCLVRFALDQKILDAGITMFRVETLAGILEVTPIWHGQEMVAARVGMGEPILSPKDIPIDVSNLGQNLGHVLDNPMTVDGYEFNVSYVSMGNPHAIAFVEDPVDDVVLTNIGPLMENHSMFPNRINFEIVNVIGKDRLKVRVWERGSGITMACGTGACAVAVAAKLKGLIGNRSTIELPGGNLTVEWEGKGSVILEGPVEKVFEGTWSI